jgi:hypothetical protein
MPSIPSPEALLVRIARLEAQVAIRGCIQRYMSLCDTLCATTPLEELVGLFTNDAVWEGVGAKYATTYPRLVGRAQLSGMFSTYMTEPAHFALNAHYLTSEAIELTGDDVATGHWLMLQVSTYAAGNSQLNSARLEIDFRREGTDWRMSHFRTGNLFTRPVDRWDAPDVPPTPR